MFVPKSPICLDTPPERTHLEVHRRAQKQSLRPGFILIKAHHAVRHLRSHLCLFKLSAEARMVEYLSGDYSLSLESQGLLKD